MKALLYVTLVVSGCGFQLSLGGAAQQQDGSVDDANAIDSSGSTIDAPPGSACFGSAPWSVCFATTPTGPVVIPPTLDTDSSSLCAVTASAPPGCVVAGNTVSVPTGTSLITGSRPLILVGVASIEVVGTLDAASHRGGTSGPGANATGCVAPTTATSVGGGAGGSFGALGGDGGDNENGSGGGAPGVASSNPTTLRGGCAGGRGGATGGSAGDGGGAVLLVAGNSITIVGAINVSGAGASGSPGGNHGGGGGGSGGMIVLGAPTLGGAGRLIANGGGGGGGAGGPPAASGAHPDPAQPLVAAQGGQGTGDGGDGGDGGAAAIRIGEDGQASNGDGHGGGGGAGSVGVIITVGGSFGGARSPSS